MGENSFWVSTAMFLLLLGVTAFLIYKLKTDPRHAGQDLGKIVLYYAAKYIVTWLILLQAAANIAEAGIIGSIQDESVNVSARMTAHIVIALASIIAAFSWVKMLRQLFGVPNLKIEPRKKFALGIIYAFLAFTMFLAAVSAPIYNMYILANGLNNTVQLNLFFMNLQVNLGWIPQSRLAAELMRYGLPLTYEPFQALHNAMVSSIGITVFHLFLTVWEVLFALSDSIKDPLMGQAFDVEPESKDDKKKDDKKKDGGEREKEKGSKDKKSSGGKEDHVNLLVNFMVDDESKREKWTNIIMEIMTPTKDGGKDEAKASEIGVTIASWARNIALLNSKKTGDKSAKDLANEIREKVLAWSGNRYRIPFPSFSKA
jgi:hypothetical protein